MHGISASMACLHYKHYSSQGQNTYLMLRGYHLRLDEGEAGRMDILYKKLLSLFQKGIQINSFEVGRHKTQTICL